MCCGCSLGAHVKIIHHLLIFSSTSQHRSTKYCPPFVDQELIRKGIPHHFRAIVWQLLGNATDMPVKNQYSELLKMSSPCEKLIRRDIARTYPEHEFFKGQDSLGQEVLFNVMKARIVRTTWSFEILSLHICSGLALLYFSASKPKFGNIPAPWWPLVVTQCSHQFQVKVFIS